MFFGHRKFFAQNGCDDYGCEGVSACGSEGVSAYESQFSEGVSAYRTLLKTRASEGVSAHDFQ